MMKFKGQGIVRGQFGGAAIEYILVSLFATVFTVTAIGFVSKVIKEKVTEMQTKLGVNIEADWPSF